MIEYQGAKYNLEDGQWIADFMQDLRLKFILKESKLDDITEVIQSRIQDNLFKSKTYLGGAAEPNKPLTIIKKGHHKVFFHTGELYRSVLKRNTGDMQREVFIAEGRSLIAYWLQYGTSRMTARPFFGVTPEAYTEIKKIILEN